MNDEKTVIIAMKPRRQQYISVLVLGGLAVSALLLVVVGALLSTGISEAEQSPNDPPMNIQQAESTSTLDILLSTNIPDVEVRSTVEAAIDDEIDSAVLGTLSALTPTATPLPTDVPIEDTFVEANPFLGPDDAPITIVEFSDYNCGFCGRFHATTLEPLLEHYGDLVKFVYREYPIIGGQNTADIGAAAQCLNEQDLYWEFTDLVWANQTSPERQSLDGQLLGVYADQVGADTDSLLECLESGRGFDVVLNDFETGREFGITGTPTFFINGERFVGAQPIEAFFEIIDRKLIELDIEPPDRS